MEWKVLILLLISFNPIKKFKFSFLLFCFWILITSSKQIIYFIVIWLKMVFGRCTSLEVRKEILEFRTINNPEGQKPRWLWLTSLLMLFDFMCHGFFHFSIISYFLHMFHIITSRLRKNSRYVWKMYHINLQSINNTSVESSANIDSNGYFPYVITWWASSTY